MDSYYYNLDNPSAFSSINQVVRSSKKSQKSVQAWLSKQDVWQRHKPVVYKFPQRRTTGVACFTHVQADLADLTPLAKHNRGKRWMLLLVDCYSRYVMARALSRKSGAEVAAALKDCFESVNMYPMLLITDQGREFYNSEVKDYLHEINAQLVSPSTFQKASMAERMQRTIKSRLYRYFTWSGKRNWTTVLQKVVDGINKSHHRVIKATPQQVWDGEKDPAAPPERHFKSRFKEGDRVRIAKAPELFRKGYVTGWTDEIFTIVRAFSTNPPTFHLIDDAGEPIKGIFYSQEMVKIT